MYKQVESASFSPWSDELAVKKNYLGWFILTVGRPKE